MMGAFSSLGTIGRLFTFIGDKKNQRFLRTTGLKRFN